MKNIAINGFGRIGRLTLRNLLKNKDVNIVAINDLTDAQTLAHLFKYDSVQGNFDGEVVLKNENELVINGDSIEIYNERNPHNLPWKKLNVDVVIESTGVFRTLEQANLHIDAGADKVIISAPAKGGNVPTVVLGVNQAILSNTIRVISNASCTTNCAAPMVKVINDNFGIENGYLTTVHAYTADQRLQDAPHRDLRRARAAAVSIIPTTTGAAKAVGLVIPEMQGKLDGVAYRVPVPTGSYTELTLTVKKEATVAGINALFKAAAETEMAGVLKYSEEPLVSSDIVGSSYSCIVDAEFTKVNGNLVRVCGWYDNEAGYAARVADLVNQL